MDESLFTPDFKETPYWWDAAPRPSLPETALPDNTDAVVVGSGQVGLSAPPLAHDPQRRGCGVQEVPHAARDRHLRSLVMTTMKHRSYVAKIEYDAEIDSFFGDVVNTNDTITFYGRSAEELKSEFARSIKTHLAFCKRNGVEPGKPYSGRIPLRISSELHHKLDANAATHGMSLNAYIARKLAEDVADVD